MPGLVKDFLTPFFAAVHVDVVEDITHLVIKIRCLHEIRLGDPVLPCNPVGLP